MNLQYSCILDRVLRSKPYGAGKKSDICAIPRSDAYRCRLTDIDRYNKILCTGPLTNDIQLVAIDLDAKPDTTLNFKDIVRSLHHAGIQFVQTTPNGGLHILCAVQHPASDPIANAQAVPLNDHAMEMYPNLKAVDIRGKGGVIIFDSMIQQDQKNLTYDVFERTDEGWEHHPSTLEHVVMQPIEDMITIEFTDYLTLLGLFCHLEPLEEESAADTQMREAASSSIVQPSHNAKDWPKNIRQPFDLILQGAIQLDHSGWIWKGKLIPYREYSEFMYWKGLFLEAHFNGEMSYAEVIDRLAETQHEAFARDVCEQQIQYLGCNHAPLTRDTITLLFPEFFVGKPNHINLYRRVM